MNPYIIKKPLITEKTVELANKQNIYTFAVGTTTNKNQIKEAIEELYGVTVVAINTVVRQPEEKKTGKKRLNTVMPKKKKALVKLAEGQTIDLFDISE